jgi:hypothetical protein
MKNSDALKATLGGLGILLFLASSLCAIPQTINYQGLLEEDGSPVEGSREVTFRIYASSEGGTILWYEEQMVTFTGGVFSVLLGSTKPISASVFDGGRRWLSLSISDGPEILPRGELVSVGYAFFSGKADSSEHAETAELADVAERADFATNAGLLDSLDSSQFAGASHTHDSIYYRQSVLGTSDGSPPNEGSELVDWHILTGVPDGFADGIDDKGTGPTDHGQLTGLLDNDHPQYALADSLRISDGTPPNEGRNMLHWNVLTGVPGAIADGIDDVTVDAGDIVTGTMSPERIEGVALVGTDERLLSLEEKDELTGGDTTALHIHIETGDISAITAGEGLTGGGKTDSVEISHAEDATSLPLAHHTPPIVAYERPEGSFSTASKSPTVVVSDSLVVPTSGFILVSFTATQKLDVTAIPDPPYVTTKRYIADYGVSIDTQSSLQYSVRSSMLDTDVWFAGLYVPTKPVSGSAVFEVATPGKHLVHFLTKVAYDVDTGARSVLEDISLNAVFIEHDSSSLEGTMLISNGAGPAGMRGPTGR